MSRALDLAASTRVGSDTSLCESRASTADRGATRRGIDEHPSRPLGRRSEMSEDPRAITAIEAHPIATPTHPLFNYSATNLLPQNSLIMSPIIPCLTTSAHSNAVKPSAEHAAARINPPPHRASPPKPLHAPTSPTLTLIQEPHSPLPSLCSSPLSLHLKTLPRPARHTER